MRKSGNSLLKNMKNIIDNDLTYKLLNRLMFNSLTRKYLIRYIKKVVSSNLDPGKQNIFSKGNPRIQHEKKMMAFSIIQSLERSIEKKILNPNIAQEVLKLWAKSLIRPRQENKVVNRFYQKNGCRPPWFLVISPGHFCNLKCRDCYANSAPDTRKLHWHIMDMLIDEARKLWDIKLVVFSGGEPFAYHSEGRGILDIIEKNPDCLFLAFTNGTLFDRKLVSRIAECKNITPAFSVEGMRIATDKRRGNGIFDKVLKSMSLMKEAGAPFGISATVNRYNHNDLLTDEFLDFFFNEQGSFYGFYFQYLPIGRNASFDLMPTPSQRVDFWKKIWHIIESRKLFLIDFWNHGPLVEGCVSAGRDGGYLYFDWDGKVMPCVFAPYSVGNIYDIYKNGKTINDIWHSPFLESIRKWQRDYGYGNIKLTEKGNWLKPCPYRDHHGQFQEWVKKYGIEPEDESSGEILCGIKYHKELAAYDEELARLFDPIWKQKYLGS